jgi:2'-hydroxyisoflavone reductase
MIELVGRETGGVFHATGPEQPMLLTELLERARGALESTAELCWADTEVLQETGVEPFKDMPFWITPAIATYQLDSIDIGRALSAGLKLRPLESTITDLFKWDESRGFPELKTGLTRGREETLLAELGPK